MKRKIGVAGILLATTFWLAGCALWQGVGPCYGVGCHAGLMAPHATQQSAQAKPANTNKSRSLTSWLPFSKKHSKPAASDAPAKSSSAPTTSSAAPSQSGGK